MRFSTQRAARLYEHDNSLTEKEASIGPTAYGSSDRSLGSWRGVPIHPGPATMSAVRTNHRRMADAPERNRSDGDNIGSATCPFFFCILGYILVMILLCCIHVGTYINRQSSLIVFFYNSWKKTLSGLSLDKNSTSPPLLAEKTKSHGTQSLLLRIYRLLSSLKKTLAGVSLSKNTSPGLLAEKKP